MSQILERVGFGHSSIERIQTILRKANVADFSIREVEAECEVGDRDYCTKAIELSFSPELRNADSVFTDYDDTLRDTSGVKLTFANTLYHEYVQEILGNVGNKDQDDFLGIKEKFQQIVLLMNNCARISHTKSGQELYIPLFELRLVACFIEELRMCNSLGELQTIMDRWMELKYVRNRLREIFIDDFSHARGERAAYEEENASKFIVANPEPLEVDLFSASPPRLIDQKLWQLYLTNYLAANLDLESYLFDLPDDVNWIVMSYGEKEIILAKMVHLIMFLRSIGKRIPNKIYVVYEGRKLPFIARHIEEFHSKDATNLSLIRVRRPGAKRSGKDVPGYQELTLPDENVSLQKVLKNEKEKNGNRRKPIVVFLDDNVPGELDPALQWQGDHGAT